MSYPGNWFIGVDPEEKQRMIAMLDNSVVIEKLKSMLESYLREVSPRRTDYTSPSWSHLQAHDNGQYEAYTKILKLLTKEK